MLTRVIETMSLEMDFETICRYATQITMEMLEADLSALALPTDQGELRFQYFFGYPPEVDTSALPVVTPGTTVAFRSGKPVFVADYRNYAGALKAFLDLNVCSGFAAPIRIGDAVAGVLTLAWQRHVDKPGDDRVELVEAVLRQIGFAYHRQQLMRALSDSKAEAVALNHRLQRVLSVSPVVIYNVLYDPTVKTNRLKTSYLSENFEVLLGHPNSWLIERTDRWYELVHPEDLPKSALRAHPEAMQTGTLDRVYRLRHKDGHYVWVHDSLRLFHRADSQIIEVVGAFMDISERKTAEAELTRHRDHLQELVLEQTVDLIAAKEAAEKAMREAKEAEEQTRYLALNDGLTGLPNRVLLVERLTQTIAQVRRHNRQFALLFIDLDRFKNINDSLGHFVGDKLLREVAKRFTTCVRETDTVSRQGGDEFVILLSDIDSAASVAEVAEKLLAIVAEPYMIDGYELAVTHSIGISIFPDDGDDIEDIMRKADTAMYKAKEAGRNNYQFYTGEMSVAAIGRVSLESDLRRALERDEFVLHYQPQIALDSGRIVGIEALIRWEHPERGLLLPEQFIGLAEDSGLIVPIGQWVLRTACRQNRAWRAGGVAAIPVAVNLSAVQLRHRDFLPFVTTLMEECSRIAQYLSFELTESVLMHGADKTVTLLQALRKMGIHLAIDDFGTDYSSLSYLKRFPIDTLKIDRTFIRDITTDADDAAITRAIISMGHSLRLKVIAEGVETREQLDFLRLLQCDEAQGYYFSKARPAEEIESLLRKEKMDWEKMDWENMDWQAAGTWNETEQS